MSYHYPQIKDADKRLRETVMNGISCKYEGDLKDIATRQAEEELEIIKNQCTAAGYLVLFDAMNASGAKIEEFCLRGTAASSIILYLIGLSNVDPLDKDIKLYPEFFYDITGSKAPTFELNVTADLHKRIFEYFDSYTGENHIERKYDSGDKLIGVYVGELSPEYAKGSDYFDTFYINFIPVDDPEGFGKELLASDIIKKCKPKTPTEYVKCVSLGFDTDAWENNAEILIKDGEMPFNQLITDREDVYEYMLGAGIEKKMAFRIAESVRKGKICRKGWPEDMVKALDKAGIPDWYRESCQKIKYLFPRAHALSLLKCYCKEVFS